MRQVWVTRAGPPEALQLREAPDPEPDPGEVRVRVAASGVNFADITMRPLWRNVAGSLEQIVPPPTGTRLWYDDRDIPALKDDISDAAAVLGHHATAIRSLTDGGYTPESVVKSVIAGDHTQLVHTGLFSVQLQPPQPDGPPPPPPAPAALPEPAVPAIPGREQQLMGLLARSVSRADPAPPIVNITTPPVSVTTPDVHVTYERGAFEMPLTVEPAVVNVTTPEVSVYPADVNVTVEPTPVTVEVNPTPVELRNEVTVEPTPVNVTVEPTPVTITNEMPEPRSVTKTIVRDEKTKQIVRILEETD